MMSVKTAKYMTGALFCAAAVNSLADADIAVQPVGTALEATANVDLCVVVPQVLIFGVGAGTDDVAKLQWTIDNAAGVAVGNNLSYSGAAAPFTAPAPLASTATAAVTANGGAGSAAAGSLAVLPVFLFSNSGADVTITASVSGGPTGGGTIDALDNANVAGSTIQTVDFTVGDGGAITNPGLVTSASAATAHTAGIVNLSDFWTYDYVPVTIPTAGTYEARVTYVAATP